MKKLIALLLSIVMTLALAGCAIVDNIPQDIKNQIQDEVEIYVKPGLEEFSKSLESEAAKYESSVPDGITDEETGIDLPEIDGIADLPDVEDIINLPEVKSVIDAAEAAVDIPGQTITILYTNDSHSYINNTKADGNGVEKPGLNFAGIAALKKDLIADGENVLLVDAGDHVQGSIYGASDEGRSIIDIMNTAGYDLATLGNHEFDYGMFRTFSNISKAQFPYVSCNFYEVETDRTVLPEYKIFECGDKRVAFIGISTPDSLTSAGPAVFQDEKGGYIYNFYGEDDVQVLYDKVQACIDTLKKDGVDYVIALGHVGCEANGCTSSSEIIRHTSGLDAFIDGHTHTVQNDTVKDLKGKEVTLTRTGCFLGAVGKMTITCDGEIKTELVEDYDKVDESTDSVEKAWIEKVDEVFSIKIASLKKDLWAYDAKNTDCLRIRMDETNLGDLIADGIYWYFNEKIKQDCDIAIAVGGSIRTNIPAGDITGKVIKTCQPYGNSICLVKIKGQNVIDALEWSAKDVGRLDENNDPVKNGGFAQVAGIRFKIDKNVESSVVSDNNGIWKAGPTGKYKVSDVKVYNRKKHKYEPIDPEQYYSIAATDYILMNCGNGYGMFKNAEPISTYVNDDYLVLAEYLSSFKTNSEGVPVISARNSPLSKYRNYLINYEKPQGSGRIKESPAK